MGSHLIKGTKYYKKVPETFNQPLLSANGTLGGSEFAVSAVSFSSSYDAYNAFDNSTSSYYLSGNTNGDYIIYSPEALCVTELQFQTTQGAWNLPNITAIAGSNDGINYTSITNSNSSSGRIKTYTLTNSTYYKYYKLTYVGNTNNGDVYLCCVFDSIFITATQLTGSVEVTKAEYDANISNPLYYKVDSVAVKNYLASQKKYLKKVDTTVETLWTQPMNITSNQPLGGNSFAVGAWTRSTGVASTVTSQSWKLFNSTYSGNMNSPQNDDYVNNGTYFIFYNPNPLKISQIGLKEPNVGNAKMKNVELLGSNNGTDWVSIASSTNGATATGGWIFPVNSTLAYKYHKFVCVVASSSSVWIGTKVFNITATEQTGGISWQECTKAEYDTLSASDRRIENRYMANVGKKYLKKITVETPFIQPVLSSDGTLGGDSFAVYASSVSNYPAYYAIDGVLGSPSYYWQSAWNTMAQYTMYNPNPFKGTFKIYSQCYTTLKVQGSNDNSNWVDVTESTSSARTISNYNGSGSSAKEFIIITNSSYKYLKIVPLTTYNANAGGYILRILDIVFTDVVEQTQGFIECNKAEYDQQTSSNRRIENRYSILKAA